MAADDLTGAACGAKVERCGGEDSAVSVVRAARPGLVELHASARPVASAKDDAASQAREAYQALLSAVGDAGAQGVQERTFGSLSHSEAILGGRQAAMDEAGIETPWPTAFIEGRPVGYDGLAGVQLYAVAGPECSLLGPSDNPFGVSFEHAGARHIYLTSRPGAGVAPASEQATIMFEQANGRLASCGAAYTHVLRTWIYLADLLDWYGDFNVIRNELYTTWGVMGPNACENVPASTGIEGRPLDRNACSMDVFALVGEGRARLSIAPLHNPLQNEAYAYGSAFSRGMALGFDGVETAFISGTASIDDTGRTVHIDDLDAQVDRTLENIDALIGTRDFGLQDVAVATVFIKPTEDAAAALERVRAAAPAMLDHGVCVRSDVCRHDLLFEIDGLAIRPVR